MLRYLYAKIHGYLLELVIDFSARHEIVDFNSINLKINEYRKVFQKWQNRLFKYQRRPVDLSYISSINAVFIM